MLGTAAAAQNGVLVQSGTRGGEASTSGQQAHKGQVAYVGMEPSRAELLRPKLADGSSPRAAGRCGALSSASTSTLPCHRNCTELSSSFLVV